MNALASSAVKAAIVVVLAALGTGLSGCAPVWGLVPLGLGATAIAINGGIHPGADTATTASASVDPAPAPVSEIR